MLRFSWLLDGVMGMVTSYGMGRSMEVGGEAGRLVMLETLMTKRN